MKELMLLAILPGILIIIYIFKKDKVEREPLGLIIKLLIFGALSTVPAIFMEFYVTDIGPALAKGTWAYAIFEAFVVAGLCEEICKFALLFFGSWNNRAFNYRFDGIVYGVAVAVGFATVENIMYVLQYGFQTGLMRAVMSVPLHAFCGVFMGIFYGAAKAAKVKGTKGFAGNMILCLIVPIIIHGIYDSLAFMSSSATTIALLAFVVAMYVVGIKYIKKFSRDDWKNGFYGTANAEAYDFNLSGHTTWQSRQGDYSYRAQAGQPCTYTYASSASAPVPRATNGASIAGLICGILGLISCGIFVLPSMSGVILGAIGKSRTPLATKNAVSTASLWIGIIGLAIGGFLYFSVIYM